MAIEAKGFRGKVGTTNIITGNPFTDRKLNVFLYCTFSRFLNFRRIVMNKTRTFVLSAIFAVCVLSVTANACEPFIDLDKVGHFDDTPNHPLVDNYGIFGWAGNNYDGGNCNDFNFSHKNKDSHFNWSNWNWGSWDHNWTGNHCGNWNFGKWRDKPCDGGDVPEPTCTLLTLAGTSFLCIFRRKK
jgi:hypothetical protein